MVITRRHLPPSRRKSVASTCSTVWRTLSSAIAANLAKGYDLDRSVERAKAYISGALAAMLDLGRGSGPMNHMFDLKGGFAE